MSSKSREGRRGVPVLFVAVIMTVAMLILVSAMALQVRSLEMSERYAIPLESGIDAIDINVVASLGVVEVNFADLHDEAAVIITRLSGSASILAGDARMSLNVTYENDARPGVINVTALMDVYAPWPYHSLDEVRCEVLIDRGLAADIDITVVTGGAAVRTVEGANVTGLRINATSLGSVIALNNGTVLSGDVHVRTATGGNTLYWNNVTVDGDRRVTMEESTGELRAMIGQSDSMGGTVTLLGKNIGGAMSLGMELSGDVGTSVVVTSRGDVKMNCSDGFRCQDGGMASINNPVASSFDVHLESAVGGIEAWGRWSSQAVTSHPVL